MCVFFPPRFRQELISQISLFTAVAAAKKKKDQCKVTHRRKKIKVNLIKMENNRTASREMKTKRAADLQCHTDPLNAYFRVDLIDA